MIHGPDVYHGQDVIDWRTLRASGVVFAFAKATEGNSIRDALFSQNWGGMQAAGLIRGAYHFARPGSHTPEEEGAWFVLNVARGGGFQPGDMAVLDLEVDGSGSVAAWARTWCDYVAARCGCKVLVYTGQSYWHENNLGQVTPAPYPLWVARYGPPPDIAGWTFWQYSDHETFQGISSACDASWFNGDEAALRSFVGGDMWTDDQIKQVLDAIGRIEAHTQNSETVEAKVDGLLPQIQQAISHELNSGSSSSGGLTPADVEAAVAAAFKKAFG